MLHYRHDTRRRDGQRHMAALVDTAFGGTVLIHETNRHERHALVEPPERRLKSALHILLQRRTEIDVTANLDEHRGASLCSAQASGMQANVRNLRTWIAG